MRHLKIIQENGSAETVSAGLITKLADWTTEGLDQTSQLKGNLIAAHAYEDDLTVLQAHPDLNITITSGAYMRIADATVRSILASAFGDGEGITSAQAALVTSFGGRFASQSSIVSFDELFKFTGITEINSNNRFNSCSNLVSIDLRNITKISGADGYQRWNFESCSKLENVGNTSNCTYFGHMAFSGCSKLQSINLSNATHILTNAFYGCTALTSIGSLANVSTIGNSAFRDCSNVQEFVNISLPSLQGTLGSSAFQGCTQIKNVVDLGSITTYGGTGSEWDPFAQNTNLETMVLPATLTTINNMTNLKRASMRWVKVLATSVPTITDISYNVFNYSTNVNSGVYNGANYPIYVKDDIWNDYLADTEWAKFNALNRLKKLSTFATDFPNG